jgi:hypothetical protein
MSMRAQLRTQRRAYLRVSAAVFVCAGALFALGSVALAPAALAAGPLPNPCTAVPGSAIAAAFGIASPPFALLSVVRTTETCTYSHAGVILTLFVGYSSIGQPGTVKQALAVPKLPHGLYDTFTNTAQRQVTFYKGTAASGIYGIVRTNRTVTKARLEALARTLYAGS